MKNKVYTGLYTDVFTKQTFRCDIRFEEGGLRITDLEGLNRDAFWPVEEVWADTVHSGGLCILYDKNKSVLKIYAKNINRAIAKYYKGRDFVQVRNDYYINFSRITSVVLTLGVLAVIGYFWILPPAAEYAAGYIPASVETKLGDYYLDYLTRGDVMDNEKTVLVQHFFDSLSWKKTYSYEIKVVQSKTINALALPGGRIIVYSALLDSLDNRGELAALLAHESAHVELKHCTKSLCRSLSYSILLSILTGDVNTTFAVLARNADLLNSLSYSRSIEEAADKQALTMLEEAGLNPEAMLNLLNRLDELSEQGWLDKYDIISTHPTLEKRKSYVRHLLDARN